MSWVWSWFCLFSWRFFPLRRRWRPKKRPKKTFSKNQRRQPENPVVYLGKSFDKKSGKIVDGFAFVHFAKDKNPTKPDRPTKPHKKVAACYEYLSKGAKWKGEPEPWLLDAQNTGGLDVDWMLNNMNNNISKWEEAAEIDILGEGMKVQEALIADTLDGQNQVTFATLDSQNAIAVTYIWGYFSGPSAWRELVEWGQVYNDQYAWSEDATGSETEMDFENIATHELGHSVGMDDLYTTDCAEETMYGYADFGEIKKRDLNRGDIAGIRALY